MYASLNTQHKYIKRYLRIHLLNDYRYIVIINVKCIPVQIVQGRTFHLKQLLRFEKYLPQN